MPSIGTVSFTLSANSITQNIIPIESYLTSYVDLSIPERDFRTNARMCIDRDCYVSHGYNLPVGWYECLTPIEQEEWTLTRRNRIAERDRSRDNQLEARAQFEIKEKEKMAALRASLTPWEAKYLRIDTNNRGSYIRVNSQRFPGYRWRFYLSAISGNAKIQSIKSRRLVVPYICFHAGYEAASEQSPYGYYSYVSNVLMQLGLVRNKMDDLIVARCNGEFPRDIGEISDIREHRARRIEIITGYFGHTDAVDRTNMRFEYDDNGIRALCSCGDADCTQ